MVKMSNCKWIAFGVVALGSLQHAHAQGRGLWYYECIDPMNMTPYSTPYGFIGTGNDFINVNMGVVGTVTMGGMNGPCYAPSSRTMDASGRFCFFTGPVGSQQSSFDDNIALSMGAPFDPVGDFSYAKIIRYSDPAVASDQKLKLFGEGGLRGWYVGASKRYFVASYADGGADINLETRVLGDAVRMRWRMRNTTANILYLGLRFGTFVGMRSDTGDTAGNTQANTTIGSASGFAKGPTSDGQVWIGYNTTPTTKPVRIQRAFIRSRQNFPSYANFQWGQSTPYGIRVDNDPTPQTPDATPVEHFVIGDYGGPGWPGQLYGNAMLPRVYTDFGVGDPVLDAGADPIQEVSDTYISDTAYLQTIKPEAVAAFGTRDVIQYIRSPWSVGDYRDPYTTIIDAPRLIATGAGSNGLDPNPMQIYVHIDNQYATVDQEVPLTNVRLTLELKEGSGLVLDTGEAKTKIISRIEPNQISNTSWSVVADGTAFGKLPFTLKVEPATGPARTLEGSILVAATPTVRIAEGPNFMTFPWSFADSSLDAILGLKQGIDYLAYRWEPELGEYVPVTSATRASGLWIVPVTDQGLLTLSGASSPSDATTGGQVTILKPGWNMIGNPYNYPVTLSQLVAVADDSPAQSLTWQELVDSGLVNSSLAYWKRNPEDPTSGTYEFTTGSADQVLPSQGYWVYVTSFNPIRITWPAIYSEGLPNSERSTGNRPGSKWQQTEKQWRLQLTARNSQGLDANNYVGVAATALASKQLAIVEPPAAINSKLQVSIAGELNGKATRLAQSLAEGAGRKEWKVLVKSDVSGDVTVTWPNISTVPRNVNLQVVDPATKTTRDLRFNGSYTFRMDQPGTRELTVQMQPGAAARALIGDVLVTRTGRDSRSGFSINYALSAGANTSIRILNGSGKEVYTLTRGRADGAGQNTATWQMRDNANRAVAPGAYQVEIVAETASGERVRKFVPINVVR